MHEVALTRSLVEIAEQHLRASAHSKAVSVSIAIGELSGVVPEAVEFCYEAVTQETLLAGSQLLIERIPGRKQCLDCRAEFPAGPQTFTCPQCDSCLLQTVAGDELKILEMEVD